MKLHFSNTERCRTSSVLAGKRVWYLNDPIEDNPNHSWWDYRTNWESTLSRASLLQPEVWHYEIHVLWPHRVFEGRHPATQQGTRNAKDDVPRVPIPDAYATELQAVISAMGDMDQPADRVGWEHAGTPGAGVLVSDTLMFQRFGPDASDSHLGQFYGLALPLLMRGLPVEPVQIETAELKRYKTLLLGRRRRPKSLQRPIFTTSLPRGSRPAGR